MNNLDQLKIFSGEFIKNSTELQERKKYELYFFEIAYALASFHSDFSTAVITLINFLKKIFDADFITFYKYEHELESLTLYKYTDIDNFPITDELIFVNKNDKTLTFKIFQENKITIILNTEDILKDYPIFKNIGFKSIIFMPLVFPKDEYLGFIHIAFKNLREVSEIEKFFLELLKIFICQTLKRNLLEHDLLEKDIQLAEAKKNLEKKLNDKIKELTQQYETISKSEKFTVIGRLIASITHEINSPLTYIKGNAELIQIYLPRLEEAIKNNDEKLKNKISNNLNHISTEIIDGVNVISEIVSNLKHISLTEAFKTYEEVNLEDLVEDALSITSIKWEGKFQITKKYQKKLPKIKVNKNLIKIVIVNILLNSINALKKSEKKNIFIETKKDRTNKKVILIIKDEGIGIKQKNLEKIFDPLFTTKKSESLGIGLSLCKDILDLHNAKMKITSKEEKGTTVKVTFKIK